MRVLVTGGAGFIGSHVCDVLLAEGHKVVVVDDLSLGSKSNIEHTFDLARAVEFHEMSILESDFSDLVEEGGFDCVFHMAANSDISAGSSNRRIDLDKTFLTTWTVLEAMAKAGIKQLVFASTSAIYGDISEPTDENFGPLHPISFYGAAKLASEAYCSAYAYRHDIRTWVFRFPNVVGPRATHGVILDFVRRLKEDPRVLRVLGDGSQEKPYVFVRSLVQAIMHGWKNADPAPFESFNIGPITATRVSRIAEIVVAEMNLTGSTRIEYGSEPIGWPGDVPTFAYDTRKMEGLGWRSEQSSDDAVVLAARHIVAEQTKA